MSKFYGEEYAKVVWRAEDVGDLKPKWTLAQCEEFLQEIDRHFTDRLTEEGWEVLRAFTDMSKDFVDFDEEEDDEEEDDDDE